MKKHIVTVTQGDWNVSTCTGSHIDGAILSVFNVKYGWSKIRRGNGDGRLFPSSEAANQWALDHGYTQVWFKGSWCPLCRKQHKWCHSRMGACAAATHPYPACTEAQLRWDAEDWTRRPVTCPDCGQQWWQRSYLLDDPQYDPERLRLCWHCEWERRKSA